MKQLIFTLIAFVCTLGHASAQQIKIGHRDANRVAVLDIGISHVAPAIVQSMTEGGFRNVRVTKLDISDSPIRPDYYASMGVTVEYQEPGNNDVFKLTYLYPLVYDPVDNVYFGGHVDLEDIKDGGNKGPGNPDNNFCVARNCVGCATIRDLNGKTTGCGPCYPVNPELTMSCTIENTAGVGAERVILAIGSLLKALATLL